MDLARLWTDDRVPEIHLVAEFAVMAVVLVLRPGACSASRGRSPALQAPSKRRSSPRARLQWAAIALVALLLAVPMLVDSRSYALVLGIDIFIGVPVCNSLHFIMGPGGMHSFGHAAYFGLGYVSGLTLKALGLPMPLARAFPGRRRSWRADLRMVLRAPVRGLSRDADARLRTDRLVHRVSVGRSHRRQQRRDRHLAERLAVDKNAYFYLALALCVAGVFLMRRVLFSPFGYALRATRDSVLRSQRNRADTRRIQWIAFIVAGTFCGLAGGLFAFSKGSISPETIGRRSIDGLVMVLLGGVETLSGPIVGAVSFIFLRDQVARHIEYWRASRPVHPRPRSRFPGRHRWPSRRGLPAA